MPDHDPKPTNAPIRILSVGQCGFDDRSLAGFLTKTFGATLTRAAGYRQAEQALAKETYRLILVNRVLDADGSSGIALIPRLKNHQAFANVPVILVSNYPEAQTEAESLGALPGFGKADLRTATASERIKSALELAPVS